MTYIKMLSNNKNGNDYIIGDIHGNDWILKEVVDTVLSSDEDRLFLVGDLFDRGSDPIEVFKILMARHNIFSARGNHEDLLLKACRPQATEFEIFTFLINGGLWVLEDSERTDWLKILMDEIKDDLKNPDYIVTEADLCNVAIIFKEIEKIHDLPSILEYVESLPYIIRVAPDDPYGFIVCHSDLPFSDTDLNAKDTLTENDILHITWARKADSAVPGCNTITFAHGLRNKNSVLVYCGHSVVIEDEDCIRKQTNHVNLDVGAYYNDCIIIANHTAGSAFLIEKMTQNAAIIEKYKRISQRISMYLYEMTTVRKHSECIQTEIRTCQSKLDIMLLIMANKVEKISNKNHSLVCHLDALVSNLTEWVSDSVLYSFAIEETTRVEAMVNSVLSGRIQSCCLFIRVQKPSLFMTHLSEIHQTLLNIKIHLGKMAPQLSPIIGADWSYQLDSW